MSFVTHPVSKSLYSYTHTECCADMCMYSSRCKQQVFQVSLLDQHLIDTKWHACVCSFLTQSRNSTVRISVDRPRLTQTSCQCDFGDICGFVHLQFTIHASTIVMFWDIWKKTFSTNNLSCSEVALQTLKERRKCSHSLAALHLPTCQICPKLFSVSQNWVKAEGLLLSHCEEYPVIITDDCVFNS